MNQMVDIMNELLERAARLCLTAHRGQVDKAGKAYFMHPMRVAMSCATDEERIVAMLHDVIEDTELTAESLLCQGFPKDIVDAVISVTRNEGEIYEEFIERCVVNPIGRNVKLRDLEDNMNLLRLESVDEAMTERFNRYLKAHRRLSQGIVGNIESEFDVDALPELEGDAPMQVTRIVSSASSAEIARIRAEEAAKGRMVPHDPLAWTGKSYNKEKPQVRMPDGSIICEEHGIGTFVKVIRQIGVDEVATLGLTYGKNYPLLSRENLRGKYTRVDGGWWLLSNFPNVRKTEFINKIADVLGLDIKAVDVAK